jgi:CHAD domain-containing protein
MPLDCSPLKTGKVASSPIGIPHIGIDADMSAREAFAPLVNDCLRQIRGNQKKIAHSEQERDGVHHLRVGLRRLQVLVGLYRRNMDGEFARQLLEGLDQLRRICGPARDWDVFLFRTLRELGNPLSGDPTVRVILRTADELRLERYLALRTALNNREYEESLLRLAIALADESWCKTSFGDGVLDGPVEQFASAVLRKKYQKLCAIDGECTDLSAEQLHRLRIVGKKLRYTAEFFRGLYPKKRTTKFIDTLVDLQDWLGSFNDAAVSCQLSRLLEERIRVRENEYMARFATDLIAGWQAAHTKRRTAEFASIWRKLHSSPCFWSKDGKSTWQPMMRALDMRGITKDRISSAAA